MCQHSSAPTAGPSALRPAASWPRPPEGSGEIASEEKRWSVIVTDPARENRRYVRGLLKEKQPEFAAMLESAGQELSCPVCQGAAAGHRRGRHLTVHMSGSGIQFHV
jgi:hypothetical protein